MDLEKQLKRPTLDQEPFFYLDSGNLEANLHFIQKNKVKNILLQEGEKGYNLKNIDCLRDALFIERLAILLCPGVRDVTALGDLVNLQHLQLSNNDKLPVDVSNLKNLRSLFIKYSPFVKGLESLTSLEKLYVDFGDESLFNEKIFKHFSNLLEIKIGNSVIKNSLKFLANNTKIEYLELNYIQKAFDLDGIQHLSRSLKRLKLISSKKIEHIELIAGLVNLEWLILSNAVPLADETILRKLKKLEALTLFGSSYFINGDLRGLRDLKNSIAHYKVENKKHYFYE